MQRPKLILVTILKEFFSTRVIELEQEQLDIFQNIFGEH